MERRNFLAAVGGLLGLGAVAKAAEPNDGTLNDRLLREMEELIKTTEKRTQQIVGRLRGLSMNDAREAMSDSFREIPLVR